MQYLLVGLANVLKCFFRIIEMENWVKFTFNSDINYLHHEISSVKINVLFCIYFRRFCFVFVVSYKKNVLNFSLLSLSFDLWNIYEIYLGNKTFSTEFVMTIQSLLMWFYRFVWCTNAFTFFSVLLLLSFSLFYKHQWKQHLLSKLTSTKVISKCYLMRWEFYSLRKFISGSNRKFDKCYWHCSTKKFNLLLSLSRIYRSLFDCKWNFQLLYATRIKSNCKHVLVQTITFNNHDKRFPRLQKSLK